MAATIEKAGPETVGKVTIPWESSAGGTFSEDLPYIRGFLCRVVTNPGSAAPDDNYDLTVADADGVSLLGTGGDNRDTAVSEQIIPSVPIAVDGILTVSIAAAGASKTGTVVLYFND